MSSFIPQDQPVYKILNEKGFWDGVELHPEGALIIFLDEPNEDMEPLNALAAERLAAYSAHLDELEAEAARKAGRAVTQRPKSFVEAMDIAVDGSRRAVALKQSDAVPHMPTKTTLGRKKATKVAIPDEAKVKIAEIPTAAQLAG